MSPPNRLLLLAAAIVAIVPSAASAVFPAGDVNGDGFDDVFVPDALLPDHEAGQDGFVLFLGSADGIPTFDEAHAAARFDLNQTNASFDARGAVGIGDVNNDGFDDIGLLSSNYKTVPQLAGGLVMIFLGGHDGIASGDPTTADATLKTDLDGWIGAPLAGLGDLDGDGFDDILVGNVNPSEMLTFRGSIDGIPSGGAALAASHLGGGLVVASGDVNGDGHRDLLVSRLDQLNFDQPPTESAHLFLGSAGAVPSGPLSSADAHFADENGLGHLQLAMGDLNGDGYDDVVIAESDHYDAPDDPHGAVFVFFGSSSGIAGGDVASADAHLETSTIRYLYDFQVMEMAVLDFDGDGYDDVVISDRVWVGASTVDTRLFLWPGGPSGPPSGTRTPAARPLHRSAIELAALGDVNGDGRGDLGGVDGNPDRPVIVYGPEPDAVAASSVALAALFAFARRRHPFAHHQRSCEAPGHRRKSAL